jgi:hypothetical protein
LESFQDTKLRLKTNDIKLIPPLLKEINDYNLAELGSVDFSYRAVCCHVLIKKQSNRGFLCLVDQRESGQDVLFRVDESGGHLDISDYLPSIIKEQLSVDCQAIGHAGATHRSGTTYKHHHAQPWGRHPGHGPSHTAPRVANLHRASGEGADRAAGRPHEGDLVSFLVQL